MFNASESIWSYLFIHSHAFNRTLSQGAKPFLPRTTLTVFTFICCARPHASDDGTRFYVRKTHLSGFVPATFRPFRLLVVRATPPGRETVRACVTLPRVRYGDALRCRTWSYFQPMVSVPEGEHMVMEQRSNTLWMWDGTTYLK